MGKSQLYEIYVATNKHPPDPLRVDSKSTCFFLRQGLTYEISVTDVMFLLPYVGVQSPIPVPIKFMKVLLLQQKPSEKV